MSAPIDDDVKVAAATAADPRHSAAAQSDRLARLGAGGQHELFLAVEPPLHEVDAALPFLLPRLGLVLGEEGTDDAFDADHVGQGGGSEKGAERDQVAHRPLGAEAA